MCIITTTGGTEKPTLAPMDATTPDSLTLLTNAPLCGAKTRAGTSCRCPALRGKTRCKLHGGKSVAVMGERNGNWKHGNDTREAVALRRQAGRVLKAVRSGEHV